MCNLGMQPLSNAYVTCENLSCVEAFYPLEAFVCDSCFLVQLDQFEPPETIFCDYPYCSSFSSSWLEHAEKYALAMIERFGLGRNSLVVEVGSNDGYLLQYFRVRSIPVLGIDPAANCAEEARKRGVETIVALFGRQIAEELAERKRADLLIANNVLAHVPDLNGFVAGIAAMLAPSGIATIEVPHLLALITNTEYDTIYHEHLSYFSLFTALRVFEANGLEIVDVEPLKSHGGSLRIFARHAGQEKASHRVGHLISQEEDAGLKELETYRRFRNAVIKSKASLWDFLIKSKRDGKVVAAYGAAAKGNTLLNYCGVGQDFVAYVVDRNPLKQGRYLPGSHIPVFPIERVAETKPEYLLILPWNLADEISEQMDGIRKWNGRFVTAIPETRVF